MLEGHFHELSDEVLARLQDVQGLEQLVGSLDDSIGDFEFLDEDFVEKEAQDDSVEDTEEEEEEEPLPMGQRRKKKREMTDAFEAAMSAYYHEVPPPIQKRPRMHLPSRPVPQPSVGGSGYSLDYFLSLLSSKEVCDRSTRSPAHEAMLYNFAGSVARDVLKSSNNARSYSGSASTQAMEHSVLI